MSETPTSVPHATDCATISREACDCMPDTFERRVLVTEAIAKALGIEPHPKFGYPADVCAAADAVIDLDPATEYRYAEILDGTLYNYGPTDAERGGPKVFTSYDAAHAARIEDTDVVVARTGASEWKIVTQ